LPGLSDVNIAIPVNDVMSTPVIKVYESETVESVANLIDRYNLNSIVVVNDAGYPLGVITVRDISIRIAAKNLKARDVSAKSIMSSPPVMISVDIDIKTAAAILQKESIGRLIVMDKGKMVGMISDKDIVSITPALIEIITEKTRITRGRSPLTETSTTGSCERCLQWSTSLKRVDGKFLCGECSLDLENL
jgi:CBS domain-containing protein